MSFLQYELKEAKTPDNDPAPHKSTGINPARKTLKRLEDLLKKIIPQIEDDYKLLTTSEEQRESYRAHIIDAVVKTLTPVELNNDAPEDASQGELDEDIDIEDLRRMTTKMICLLTSIPKSPRRRRRGRRPKGCFRYRR